MVVPSFRKACHQGWEAGCSGGRPNNVATMAALRCTCSSCATWHKWVFRNMLAQVIPLQKLATRACARASTCATWPHRLRKRKIGVLAKMAAPELGAICYAGARRETRSASRCLRPRVSSSSCCQPGSVLRNPYAWPCFLRFLLTRLVASIIRPFSST